MRKLYDSAVRRKRAHHGPTSILGPNSTSPDVVSRAVLEDRRDSLKLQMAKLVAETRFDPVAQIKVAGYYSELERQIKEAEQRLAVGTKRQDSTPDREDPTADAILSDPVLHRKTRLEKLAREHPRLDNLRYAGFSTIY